MQLADVEKKIDEYMAELEENDEVETNDGKLSTEVIQKILKHLTEKRDTLNGWLKQIEANGGDEISTVDPDARIMHQTGDGRNLDACYNVQTVVDEKHKLIVEFEVSTCHDEKGALPKMTESAKKIMGVSEIEVAADKGYYEGNDIAECEQNGTTCYVAARMQNGSHAPESRYDHENFKYDRETDSYICPEGAILTFQRTRKRPKCKADRLYSNFDACSKCEYGEKCWKNESRRGRELFRSPNQDALDAVDLRMRTNEGRAKYRERQKIVEHPFGTTKWSWGGGNYLCRTIEITTGEQSLAFLTYNFRRVFNIFKQNDKNMAGAMALCLPHIPHKFYFRFAIPEISDCA